ncbi:MAG TPA: LytTR family DNA-binding domain-containing protein [Saprospiraceae bacterium]|nr:response regulator transcription factor [Saprospiraceae bacterium]MCB9270313.1 response regulator transcription factor [Lewinellaceae bacterium]HPG09715.1 LytTR family DNA-binding domain-containing protein [Saprospiraceae bacterium]HPQ99770.1 LytTR family DNA-binding domain-containing protein [Saprospiraceae bacterium]HRV87178.1 LytTR family DNA-binding domain-containing protein [Saprospiraceae bacterium]
MKCLIVDDNTMARTVLRNMVKQIRELEICGEYAAAIDAFNHLQKESVDLLLLDVEMPGMSGLELIESLTNPPLVILITAKTDYAVQGFQLQVVDYLVKPITLPRLLQAVNRAEEWKLSDSKSIQSAESKNYFFARINNQLIRIDWDDILFLQAMGDYVVIVTPGKKMPVHSTLKALEKKIPENRFTRVHRSYIVQVSKIVNLEENSIQINEHLIPVSERYKSELMEKMNVL